MSDFLKVAGRVVRVLVATVLLLVLEVGVPAMLTRFAGWPLLERVPSWSDIENALVSPIPEEALLKVLACPLWLLWGAFTVSLLAETIAAIRGVQIHVPMLGPMQALAAGLIGSLVIVVLPIDARSLFGPVELSATPVATVVHESSRAESTSEIADQMHVVKRGDTLWKIAARKLGSPQRWGRIWKLNAHKVQADGQVFTDPDLINPGWQLRLPSSRPAAHEVSNATPPPRPYIPVRPQASEPFLAPLSPTVSPSPALPVFTVEVPSGGVVSMAFAAGLSTAYAASRFHRRRRRVPPPASTEITIAPEPEPPPVVKAMRNAHLRTYADRQEGPPSDADLMREAFSIDVPDKVVAGHRKDRTGVDIQPAGLSLGLTGPGADDAIRVIVLDLLRQADRFRVEVILSTPDAQRLFAVSAEEMKAVPGLIVTESSGAAVGRFAETHFTRSRMLIERGADSIDTLRRDDPGEVLPAVLLVTSVTDELFDQGVAAILVSADRSGAGALLKGNWPPGTTCDVREDGRVSSAEGPKAASFDGVRFFRLTVRDAADCLRQLADVHRDQSEAEEEALDELGLPTWDGHTLVRLSVLGRPVIQVRGRSGTVPLTGLQLQLFVFLALHPNGATRDEICAALWPEKAVDVGVHDPLRHLRDTLRSATGYVDKGRRDAPFVKAHGRTYRIDPNLVSVDLWDFQNVISAARNADDSAARVVALSQAAQLCRGVLAEGLICEWIDERRSPQARIQADVLSQLAELQEQDDPEAALNVLERIIVLNPDPEETWRRIIRLQLRLNRRDQARNTAALLRERLQELGVRATRETERLFSEL
ncbi:BTAD domain-containing putative transcriptional regulator [Streptosporangium saharense]|uniref:BTAD domain-containing putative transcriptional regulator n=1 Tax=Streptosporangium saharense TaxID=1706840 RepID=UPI0036B9B83D